MRVRDVKLKTKTDRDDVETAGLLAHVSHFDLD
jgi:hypothetical protein